MNQNLKCNTALALLRLGGECFGQQHPLTTASDAERREALQRLFAWWDGRVVPFLETTEREACLPFKIQTGYRLWTANPSRAFSPEVDYGVNWGLFSARDWPKWRLSFLIATGEIYAVELNALDRFAVLGVVDPMRDAAEEAVRGWADSEMTLVSLADRFVPAEVPDPVSEAAEELKRCSSALKRIRVVCDQLQPGADTSQILAAIDVQLREAGFLPAKVPASRD